MVEKNRLLQRYLDDRDPDAFVELVRPEGVAATGTEAASVGTAANRTPPRAEDVFWLPFLKLQRPLDPPE